MFYTFYTPDFLFQVKLQKMYMNCTVTFIVHTRFSKAVSRWTTCIYLPKLPVFDTIIIPRNQSFLDVLKDLSIDVTLFSFWDHIAHKSKCPNTVFLSLGMLNHPLLFKIIFPLQLLDSILKNLARIHYWVVWKLSDQSTWHGITKDV